MSTFYKRFDLGNDKDDNVIFPEVLGHWRGSSDLEGWELPTPSVIGMMLNEVGRKLGIGKVYMTGYVNDVPDGAVGHLLYVGDTWSVNETQVFDSMEAEDRYRWFCLAKGWIPTSKPVLPISVQRYIDPPKRSTKYREFAMVDAGSLLLYDCGQPHVGSMASVKAISLSQKQYPHRHQIDIRKHEVLWSSMRVKDNVDVMTALHKQYQAGVGVVFCKDIWTRANRARSVDIGLTNSYIKNSLRRDSLEMEDIRDCVARNKVTVSLGFSENDNNSLYISQCTIAPNGNIQMMRRKLKPTHMERTIFGDASGASLTNVVATPAGRLGSLSCWEHAHPLLKYNTLLQHEDIHVSAWPPVFQHHGGPSLWSMSREGCQTLSQTYAIESQSFVLHSTSVQSQAAVELFGTGATPLFGSPGGGSSAVFGPDGRKLSDDVEETKEAIIYADLDFDAILTSKGFLDCAGHSSRPDLLWLGVDYQEKKHLIVGAQRQN